MPIAKKPLQTLFDAMFHGKREFGDFMHGVSEEDLSRSLIRQGAKYRELINPSKRLRDYLDFLRLFVVDFLPVHEDAVFSYRKGVSARDAVELHASSRHFFVTDIQAFFPNISRDILRQTIRDAADAIPIADLEVHLEHLLDLLCVGGVLPVGFSSSPGLSNAALYVFDVRFHARCRALGLVYTRYADDIILSAAERLTVETGERALYEELTVAFDGALQLHEGKSRYLSVGGKVKLLGMVLLPNGRVSVDRSVKNEVETMIHLYLRDRTRFNALRAASQAKPEARLAGLLNYVNTVDRLYLEKLRRKYGTTVVDLFLRRSFG